MHGQNQIKFSCARLYLDESFNKRIVLITHAIILKPPVNIVCITYVTLAFVVRLMLNLSNCKPWNSME